MQNAMKKKITQGLKELERGLRFLRNDIWRVPLRELSPRKSFLVRHLRVLILAVRGFREDKVLLRAPALTYYSMFSIVPIAALAFGIAKGFGLEMYLERQLAIALSGREDVLSWIMEITNSFLSGASGTAVAAVGLGILIYTVSMLLTNIEDSFNEVWQVNKARTWARKFSDYFAMMFIAPLFFIMAGAATVYLTTLIQENGDTLFNPIYLITVRLIPYFLLWTVFTILYMVMPNTRVKFSSALMAGIIAGTMFQLVQWGYVNFQIGATKYGAIYGSFAALPLLLIWMQVSWIVVLFGAELSFANQNVDNYEFETESKNMSPFNRKILSLYILHLLYTRFESARHPLSPEGISTRLHMPNSLVRSILNELESIGLLVQVDSGKKKSVGYVPAVDIRDLTIKNVLEKLDHRGMDVLIAKPSPTLNALKQSLHSFYEKFKEDEENRLIKDL